MDRVRVGFDATALLGPRTGVGVFASEVLARANTDPALDVTAFALTWRGRSGLADALPEGVRINRRRLPARVLRALWRRVDRPPITRWIGPVDVVHGPNFVVPPAAAAELVTVHDLTSVHSPELCTADARAYPDLIRRAVDRGVWIHTPSRFVQEEVVAAFDIPAERVVAIANGVTPVPDAPAGSGARQAGGDTYVLALGTVEPRKDLPALVAAFDSLAPELPSLRLVIAGPDGWGAKALEDAIDGAGNRDRIVRRHWLSDAEKAGLLRGARALAFPSRYEGFGLPPLEAMSVGVPVVATTAGAIPEVVGSAAELVPVGDGAALIEALRSVLVDPARRTELVAAGSRQAAKYSWDICAVELSRLYQQLAA